MRYFASCFLGAMAGILLFHFLSTRTLTAGDWGQALAVGAVTGGVLTFLRRRRERNRERGG